MKLKKIEQILKRNKTIILYHGPDDIQFLSDGAALYPMFNLPELTKESIFTMFDIPEEKASKFDIRRRYERLRHRRGLRVPPIVRPLPQIQRVRAAL